MYFENTIKQFQALILQNLSPFGPNTASKLERIATLNDFPSSKVLTATIIPFSKNKVLCLILYIVGNA